MYNKGKQLKTRIGVFAQGQILCISPNGLQAGPLWSPPHFGWPKMNFDRTSRHFRAIRNFFFFDFFFHKMAAGGHFGWPKITFDRISRHFRSIRNFFFHKMAVRDHFGWPKITFDRISRHFRSIRNFYFFSQNGCQRPFWMTENHFLLHFLPFQINMQLWFFFHKMAAGGHFGWPQITFDHISRHFRSIPNFLFLFIFHKMAAGGHLGWPKITFECISRHFRSIRNFLVFEFFFSKWPLCVINGYAKYEVDRWICDTVRDATSFLSIFIQNGHQRPFCFFRLMTKIIGFRCGGGGDGCATKNIISPKFSNFGDIISFSYMGQNVKTLYIFGYLRGPGGGGGGLQWSDWAYLAFQLSSHLYLCTCEIRKQSDLNF